MALRFIRENFYPVMAMGELDLFAEFVDLLRQYGCDATNDVQVRDGTRYLMGLYRKAGKSWIAHRESYEEGDVEPYELVHKPWTAIAGIKRRRWDPAARGSYGAIFRARFPAPTANPSVKAP